jgi:hypothetical protein
MSKKAMEKGVQDVKMLAAPISWIKAGYPKYLGFWGFLQLSENPYAVKRLGKIIST